MKKLLFLPLIVLVLSQCTDLVEGTIRQSLIGTWEVAEVMDIESGDISYTADGDLILFLFEDRMCNSFSLSDDGSLDSFYADGSSSSDDNDGTWGYEFLDLRFNFNDGDTLIRSFSVDSETLIMPDTIAGKAKSYVFIKTE